MIRLIASTVICFMLSCATSPQTARADEPQTRPALPFEGEIRGYEASDHKQMPPKGATLFVGSSSIRFWSTLATDFPSFAVINRGFGGSCMSDAARYVDRIVTPYAPGRIVLYEGDNDIAAGKSPQQILDDLKTFIANVRASMPKVQIYVLAIKPSPSRWKLADKTREANRLIEELVKQDTTLSYIDVFTPMLGDDGKPKPELYREDNLHMTRAGYELWTRVVGEKLK